MYDLEICGIFLAPFFMTMNNEMQKPLEGVKLHQMEIQPTELYITF